MNLEPTDFSHSSPVNPYAMQHQRMPSSELVLETQSFVRKNPGVFEELHRQTKDLSPVCFDGIRAMFHKALSSRFQASHTIQIGDAASSKYSLGATYVGESEFRANEITPVLMAEMDGSGNLNCQMIHNLSKKFKGRIMVQTEKSTWNAFQVDTTIYGKNSATSIAVVNPNAFNKTGIFVGSYLQRLHPKFDIGAEIVCQSTPQVPLPIFMTSIGARLSGGTNPFSKPSPIGISTPSYKWTSAISVGHPGFHLSYHRNCSENLQVGVDYEYSIPMQTGEVSLNYQVSIPDSGFTLKASVDSSATIKSLVEKRMRSLPLALVLSAMMNYKKNQSIIGFGITLG